MVKILITGFEPFGGDDENPTRLIARNINGRVINGAELVGLVLPVSYSRAKAMLLDALRNERPDVYIGMGLAPGNSIINVEKFALNIANGKDNDEYYADDEAIIKDGPLAYISTLPIKPIVSKLRDVGIPARESYHAGTYLCNYVMYLGLHYSSTLGIPTMSGFIHFPYNSEYISRRGSASPSLPLSSMINAIIRTTEVVLERLVGDPYKKQ
ncbi:MAG: pyroglutamyl-peptidase I [Thermocladium sp.]